MRCLNLNTLAVFRYGVMTLGASRKKLKIVAILGQCLTQAPDYMSVKREVPTGEPSLKFVNDIVQAFDEIRDVVGRMQLSLSLSRPDDAGRRARCSGGYRSG